MKRLVTWCVLASSLFCASAASAQEPGWWGVVFAQGEQQRRIEATPILERPYRPFHFYGNTVRRQFYRGTPLPEPRDFINGAAALLFQR